MKILGVIFTAEVFDIWEQNVEEILNKISSLIFVWGKRKLTLPGIVTVFKVNDFINLKVYSFISKSTRRTC